MARPEATSGAALRLVALLLLVLTCAAAQSPDLPSSLTHTGGNSVSESEFTGRSHSRELQVSNQDVPSEHLQLLRRESEDGLLRSALPESPGLIGALLRAAGKAAVWVQSTLGLPVTGLRGGDHVWPPFTFGWRTVIATILGFLAAAMANAGGVGGGPLFVPLVNLLLGYDPKSSAALSKSMVFGGMLASTIFNIQQKHPRLEKALIDFDVAVLMQPLLLLGISIGVSCNVVLPAWLIRLLLCALLFFMTYKTSIKGISTWKQEVKQAEKKKAAAAEEAAPASAAEENGAPGELHVPLLQKATTLLSKLQSRPASQGGGQGPVWHLVKWRNLAEVAAVWAAYLLLQITKVYVPTCGALYWLLNVVQIPISVGVSYVGGTRLLAEHRRRLAGAHELGGYADDETQWGGRLLLQAPLYALATGTIGGLFGIGGAVVMGPVLLELGLLPQVTQATSSFMILFSSSLSVVEYYLLGRLPTSVALYLWSLTFVAALFGLSIVKAIVTASGKASIIIFILGAVIGASAFVILIVGSVSTYFDWIGGAYMGFSPLCRG